MSQLLSIGELADRAGVATTTLRYYDRLGLVPAAAREGGKRRYRPEAVRRVQVIRLCQQAGFRLDEIQRLLADQRDWPALADTKLAELDHRIEELRAARELLEAARHCGCHDLEGCAAAAHTAGTVDVDGLAGRTPASR